LLKEATMSIRSTVIPIVPVAVLPGVEAASKVQPRSVKGRYTRLRWAMLALTQLFFFGMPWLQWGGRQMVRFDLEAKRFYLGALVLLPQDLIFLTGLLVLCALLLFVVTTVAGRVWCGFSCPQTVYTALFMWVERQCEGERHQRLRLDQSPWSAHKLVRRGGKHLAWLAISVWTGFTLVGWFSPIRAVSEQALSGAMGPWDLFWTLFYGAATYGNAGFLREKVCQHMCPYGRFQGALMDADTLIVSYDARRGEPRATLREGGKAAARAEGACVDCTLCVQVCPVGIDIRQGLQSACIGCAVCIDACDAVMDKLQQPRGLIRYASQRELAPSPGHTARPARRRAQLYTGLLLLLAGWMAWTLVQRPDVRLDVIRDRGVMARLAEDGGIENVYRLQLTNQTTRAQRVVIAVEGLPQAQLVTPADTLLAPMAARVMTVSVRLPAAMAAKLAGQTLAMRFSVASRSEVSSARTSEASTFVLPR
jgi:cytochrome c oxidase accessory protein FixG